MGPLRQGLPWHKRRSHPSAGAEELDAAEGDMERPVGELLFDLQVQQPSAKLFFGDLIGRALAEIGQLSD